MGAINSTALLPLLFPHRSSCVLCRGTLTDVGERPPTGKQLGQLPSGFSRQFWIQGVNHVVRCGRAGR